MRAQIIPSRSLPLPPACPSCLELMSFKVAEESTLLGRKQLNNYTFECIICGCSNTRLVQDELD